MALREPRRLARVALVLWIVWAVTVWNVVFDHVIELAGRRYLHAAALAAQAGGYARIDDWMRPAVTSGLWTASVSALLLLAIGLISIRLAHAGRRSCA
jgi:hypothetical protein